MTAKADENHIWPVTKTNNKAPLQPSKISWCIFLQDYKTKEYAIVTCSYYTDFFRLFLCSFQLAINILVFILPQKMYGFDA